MTVAVHLENVSRRYTKEGRTIAPVQDLTLDIPAGEISALIGRSGTGKTTLLRLIAGLEKPDGGRIVFANENGNDVHPQISVVFQEHRLFPWMTVWQNVAVALRHEAEAVRRKKVSEVLELTGLAEAAALRPSELSGGMSQRVGFARALVSGPDLLLLDEAFSALDALTRRELHNEFVRIHRERPVTTVLVTHDVSEAVMLARRVWRFGAGGVLARYDVPAPYPRRLASEGVSELIERVLGDFFDKD